MDDSIILENILMLNFTKYIFSNLRTCRLNFKCLELHYDKKVEDNSKEQSKVQDKNNDN